MELLKDGILKILSIYEEKMHHSSLGNLQRVMSILKSKTKDVYLKKIIPGHCCTCDCHKANTDS